MYVKMKELAIGGGGAGIVFETVRVEYSPGDYFTQIAYLKQSWTCAVD